MILLLILYTVPHAESKRSMSRSGSRSMSRVATTLHTSSRRRRRVAKPYCHGDLVTNCTVCNGQYDGKRCCKRGVIVNSTCYTNTALDNNGTLCHKRYNNVVNGTCTLVNPIILCVDISLMCLLIMFFTATFCVFYAL